MVKQKPTMQGTAAINRDMVTIGEEILVFPHPFSPPFQGFWHMLWLAWAQVGGDTSAMTT